MTGGSVWREPVRGAYPDPGYLALPGRERLETWFRRRQLAPPRSAAGDGEATMRMPALSSGP